jgi:hypothetical protein
MAEWIKTAKVGDKVVCVNNVPREPGTVFDDEERPVIGKVYTIRAMWVDTDGDIVMDFEELRRSQDTHDEYGCYCGYAAYRFRPVTPRMTDIAWAHAILRKATKPVKEQV